MQRLLRSVLIIVAFLFTYLALQAFNFGLQGLDLLLKLLVLALESRELVLQAAVDVCQRCLLGLQIIDHCLLLFELDVERADRDLVLVLELLVLREQLRLLLVVLVQLFLDDVILHRQTRLVLLDRLDLLLLILDLLLALLDEEAHLLQVLDIVPVVALVSLQLLLDDRLHRLDGLAAEGRLVEREEVVILLRLGGATIQFAHLLFLLLLLNFLRPFLELSLRAVQLILALLAEVSKVKVLEDLLILHVHQYLY